MFLLTGLRSQELIDVNWRDLTLKGKSGKKPKARIREQKNQKGAGSVMLYP